GPDLEDAYAEALAAMADDLNTPIALAAALRGASAVVKADRAEPLSGASSRSAKAFLDRADALLGIVRSQAPALEVASDDDFEAEVDALLQQREEARAAKDWARADEIRARVDALGVEVMDTPSGPTWRRA
ncbi:CysS/YqeB C-terminal domain-containing protein, partial [Rubrivirga sp.]|uniref:CysS/YqeB C-terminal domain-containing protein n=1 Tax=Rubrivirga sp. TaxID=1885344 RepID=UPI003C7537EC